MPKSPTHLEVHSEIASDFDIVHAGLLRGYPELVREMGWEPATLLAKVGLLQGNSIPDLLQPTYHQLATLLELTAKTLDCPDFGMRLAQFQHKDVDMSLLGRGMRTAPTFGEALHFVTTHSYAHSLGVRIWMHSTGEQEVFFGHDILLESISNRGQVVEQVLLLGHLGAIDLTGGKVRARGVFFRHQRISDLRNYQRFFGCEPRFGQNADGLAFRSSDMAQAVTTPDRQAHEAMVAYIEQQFIQRRPPTHAEVRGAIMRLLGAGLCDNQRVADDLGIHLRTLHRRLRAEGTSFQEVKDEVRRDVLLYCLQQTDLKFSRISEQLGFSEQAVLTRKCRRWFDASPTEIREQARLQH